MNKKQWYELLFENYGQKYDDESFVQGTVGECDFIEKEIEFDKSLKLLDVGYGTGRHSIELSKRGYNITGIYLSESQLATKKVALFVSCGAAIEEKSREEGWDNYLKRWQRRT